jgi:hypothetical protein
LLDNVPKDTLKLFYKFHPELKELISNRDFYGVSNILLENLGMFQMLFDGNSKIEGIKDILWNKQDTKKYLREMIPEDNKVIINNKNIKAPNEILNGKNDHRIVMALSIMLSVYGGMIEGVEAVNKSYPSFFDDLKSLGVEVMYE